MKNRDSMLFFRFHMTDVYVLDKILLLDFCCLYFNASKLELSFYIILDFRDYSEFRSYSYQ